MDPVGVGAVVVVLVAGSAVGAWRRRTSGRLRLWPAAPVDPGAEATLLAGLGVEPGVRATLLQFSSARCAPCRTVRRIGAEIAETVPGVRHVEVDAEAHLDAVRALGIWRTPTVLVVDRAGRVTRRATGVPDKQELLSAVSQAAT